MFSTDNFKTLPELWTKSHASYMNEYKRKVAVAQLLEILKELKPEAKEAGVSKMLNTLRSNFEGYWTALKAQLEVVSIWQEGTLDKFNLSNSKCLLTTKQIIKLPIFAESIPTLFFFFFTFSFNFINFLWKHHWSESSLLLQ